MHNTRQITMQRRHFEFIAETIRRDLHLAGINPADRAIVARVLADALRETNPRFDSSRFQAACA